MILEIFGRPVKIIYETGLGWYFPLGVVKKKVSMELNTIEIKGSSVPDKGGSPLNVSVVITYAVENPLATVYNVDNPIDYLKSQSLEVVKRVISYFPYRSNNE